MLRQVVVPPYRLKNLTFCATCRLIRVLLGPTAISPNKLECGLSLVVLGILVAPSLAGISFSLSAEKAAKWLAQLADAIENRKLDSGAAQKLAGRLSWATQHLFYRHTAVDLRYGVKHIAVCVLAQARPSNDKTSVRAEGLGYRPCWRPAPQSTCLVACDNNEGCQ